MNLKAILTMSLLLLCEAHAGAASCLSVTEAGNILQLNGDKILSRISDRYEFPEGYLDEKEIKNRLKKVRWVAKSQKFETASLVSWQCYAGAECWIYAATDCQGHVSVNEGGED